MESFVVVSDHNIMCKILACLTNEGNSLSLPVRGMLNLIVKSKLPNGNVYVYNCEDISFDAIAVVHDSSIYCIDDNDLATIFVRNPNLNTYGFFKKLAEHRNWKNKSVVIFYLDTRLSSEIVTVMNNSMDCYIHGPTNLFLAVTQQTIYVLKERLAQSLLELPKRFTLEKIRLEDAHLMAETWTYPVPNKSFMFQWMAINLPSVSIRDNETGRLVAWILTYTCGAGAAHYVHPDYRRHGLGKLLSLASAVQFWEELHFPRYGGFVEGNSAAAITMESSFPNFKTLCATNWIYLKPKLTISKI